MRRSGSRRLLVVALATCAVAGCRLFVDLDGLTGGTPPDAATNDASHDVIATPDATNDAPLEAANDAGSDVDAQETSIPPCAVATNLLGSDVIAGKAADVTPADAIDAVGFTAPDGGVARCAWFFVDGVFDAGTLDLNFGVYSNNASDAPDTLVAKATMKNVVLGWNHAPLDVPVVVNGGEDLWLAYHPSVGQVGARVSATCGPRLYEHSFQGVVSGLPSKFTTTVTFTDTCATTAYLGP